MTNELKRFKSPGFSIMLPKGFRDESEVDSQIVFANRERSSWLWGNVGWEAERFSREDFEGFATGRNCPADQGQAVFHKKRVKTKFIDGVRLSCGDPEGDPVPPHKHVSGWMHALVNSKRFNRRYVIHLDFWADPRDKKVQAELDRIVLSFRETGTAGLVPRKKRGR